MHSRRNSSGHQDDTIKTKTSADIISWYTAKWQTDFLFRHHVYSPDIPLSNRIITRMKYKRVLNLWNRILSTKSSRKVLAVMLHLYKQFQCVASAPSSSHSPGEMSDSCGANHHVSADLLRNWLMVHPQHHHHRAADCSGGIARVAAQLLNNTDNSVPKKNSLTSPYCASVKVMVRKDPEFG